MRRAQGRGKRTEKNSGKKPVAKKPLTREPPTPDVRCYLCARVVQADDKVVRVHETTVHRRCYEADIQRGR